MIRILFSPSEGKNFGGNDTPLKLLGGNDSREEILQAYNAIVLGKDKEAIQKLFGFKKFEECIPYIADVFASATLKAIERYSGVAYDYLNYAELDAKAQKYVDEHTIIFSNLFGPIKADDHIPIYKVKQGNTIGTIKPELYYKKRFSYQLDLLLGEDEILDLRAGYYEKFYKSSRPVTTLKFLKNGKTVSHWAKAYRGIVLREMAKAQTKTLEELQKLELPSLACEAIEQTKNKTEIIYKIIE